MKHYLLAFCLLSSVGAEPQLFVRNQPFSGPVRWFSSRTLAPLDGLLQSLGCSWQLEDGTIRVACRGEGGPALTQVMPITLEGRPVRLEQHLQQERVYVDVDQVAAALQCNYRRSQDGRTVDIYGPLLGQGLGQGALRGSSDEVGFPVQLQQMQVASESGRLRGYVRLKNEGSSPFKWVLVRVSLYEKSGELLARCSELVRDLGPQQNAWVQLPRLQCRSTHPLARVEFEAR